MPTLINSFSSGSNVTGINFITLTKPAGLVINNLIFIQINTATNAVPTPPPGFFPVPGARVLNATCSIRLYQKVATSSEPDTYRITAPDGVIFSAGICALAAVSLTYPVVHQLATNTSDVTTTSKVWNQVTNVDTNTILLCFGAFVTTASSTPHAGMTERWDASSATTRPYLMTQSVAAAGATGTRTATVGSATRHRTVTLSISESNDNPTPLPMWGLWPDGGSLSLSGISKKGAINTSVTGTADDRTTLIVAPPVASVRLKFRIDWSTTTVDVGIGSSTNTLFNGFPTAYASSSGSSNFNNIINDTDSGSFTREYEIVTGSWLVNRENIAGSPPTMGAGDTNTTPDAIAWHLWSESNGDAGNGASADIEVTLVEMEFDDGTIIYPDGVDVTAFPVLVELAPDSALYATQFGVLVEIAASGLYLTQFPVFVEFEFVEPGVIMPVTKPDYTGTRAMHKILPGEITGYAFDPEHSWWSIVVPEATENLIINPSFEVFDTIGYDWDALGWTSVSVVDDSAVGSTKDMRCLKLIGNNVGDGEFWYTGDVVGGGGLLHVTPGAYTWSLDIYSLNPYSVFELEMRYSSSTIIKTRRYSSVGSGWQRYYMTYIEGGVGDVELLFRDVSVSGLTGNTFFTDAWQFEKKRYMTTYADGDMVGYYDTRPTQSYYWRGEPHRSVSVRRVSTASGGREVSLSDEFGLYTTAIIGLGMSPVEHEIQALANGRELYRGSHDLPRDFTITSRLFAENWALLSQKRHELIRLLRSNSTPEKEPLLLRYQPTDDKGIPFGFPLEIICAYSSGLQGNITNLYQETLPVQFHASNPFLAETIDSSHDLLINLSLTPMGIVYRDDEMEFQNLEGGASGGADFDNVAVVSFSQYNRAIIAAIEITGDTNDLEFAGIARTTNTVIATLDINNEYEWNDFDGPAVTTGTFNALETNGGFFVLGGDFTRTDTDVWNNIAVGLMIDGLVVDEGFIPINNLPTGLDDTVYAIESHSDNSLFVGGAFEDEAGEVSTDWPHLFRLFVEPTMGEAYAETVLGGVGGIVYAIKSDQSRYVYIGGNFTNVYTLPAYADPQGGNHIIAYDTQEDAWVHMGTINYDGVNGTVYDIDIDTDGTLYIIGDFLSYATELIPLSKIAQWNGYSWDQPFDFGILWDGDLGGVDVRFEIAPDGILWFYSRDILHGFLAVPTVGDCHLFGWKDGIFYAPFYEVKGGSPSQAVSDLKFLPSGEMLISFRALGTSIRVPYLNRVTYYGGADTYPTVILTSGQPQFVVNHSVNASIYFREDTVLNNLERMQIAMSRIRANIFSNMRLDMSNVIQSGATNIADFRLVPGENRISVFLRVHTGVEDGGIVWKNQFWSMDATVANELFR